jgi:hypothetical protein
MSSPFFHYNSAFDAQSTILRHAVPNLVADPDYATNFIGVRIDPKFLPSILDERKGLVEGPPIPANWHADIAEFAAALRAVELAHGTFTMAELGCGWGCWMNITGRAARNRGLDVHLIGIEADDGHIVFAKEACATNGFTPESLTLLRGIAAAREGVALFPRQRIAGSSWGLEPVFGASEAERQAAADNGTHDICRMIPLDEVISDRGHLDLLHIDIQGGEADLVEATLSVLGAKVAYLVIGTHSREIEGRLFAALLKRDWRLEIERPAILMVDRTPPVVSVDGVQGWRNPRLIP